MKKLNLKLEKELISEIKNQTGLNCFLSSDKDYFELFITEQGLEFNIDFKLQKSGEIHVYVECKKIPLDFINKISSIVLKFIK